MNLLKAILVRKKTINTVLTQFLFLCCLGEAFFLGYNWPHPVEPPFIDPALQPYLDSFERDAEFYRVPIKPETLGMVQFQDLPDHYVGFCNSAGDTWANMGFVHTNVIVISNKIKDQLGDCYFKAIMYHELGHCLLGKGHDPDNSLTIMDPAPIGLDSFWCTTWNAQVKDLFTREYGGDVPDFQMRLEDDPVENPLPASPQPRTP